MFSGPVRPESTAASYSQHHWPPSYNGDQHSAYRYSERPHHEPPRPLEPRPTLHSSLSDTTSMQRRHDSYRSVGSNFEYRQAGPSLPRLSDILTPGSVSSETPSYSSNWHHPTSTAAPNRSQYAPSYVHPPMVLEPHAQPQNSRPRSWEMSAPTSAPEAQPAQSVHTSPYTNYPPEYGRSPDVRYDHPTSQQAPMSLASGVPSPYSAVGPESSPFRGPTAGYERGPLSNASNTSAENTRKYLGIREIPGEGTFHFYEGGFRIPTHVDGEHVNPAWGLTKANKPRKRLALACLDCREKKIKCEPHGSNSCLQCEKAKRPCRRNPTQQSQAESVSGAEWSPSGPSHSRAKASVSDPTPAPSHDLEQDGLSKRRSREDPSPPSVPSKKHRSASPLAAIISEAPLPLREGRSEDTAKSSAFPRHGAGLTWEDDPYAAEPDVTLRLVEEWFAHFNSATYCLFPYGHFMHWLKNSPDKCQNERTVLYAMLATATIFADEQLAGFGRHCARVALDSLRVGTIHLCTAHTRILLVFYTSARGDYDASWEHAGAAIRAVQHLHYHTEAGCLDDSGITGQARCEFDFSVMQHAECKRRTFWTAFFLDRDSSSTVTLLKPQDIYVRLPCTEEMYENGLPPDAPYLNNGIVDPIKALLTAGSPLSPMAWHVLVASIWGDVVDFISRAPHQAASSYHEAYEKFYAETGNRLQGWLTRLPEHLHYSNENLDRSIRGKYAGTLISIHAMYHLCCMKLNRCLRHALAHDSIKRNIRAAHDHGHQMLQMMCAFSAARHEAESRGDAHASATFFTAPFAADATLAAVDIVSAGGTDSTLATTLDEISGGMGALQDLSRYWRSAHDHARVCERRFYQIQNILKNPGRAKGGAWLGRKWGMEFPLEEVLSAEDDVIYGLPDAMNIYWDAFGEAKNPRHQGHSKAGSGGLRLV